MQMLAQDMCKSNRSWAWIFQINLKGKKNGPGLLYGPCLFRKGSRIPVYGPCLVSKGSRTVTDLVWIWVWVRVPVVPQPVEVVHDGDRRGDGEGVQRSASVAAASSFRFRPLFRIVCSAPESSTELESGICTSGSSSRCVRVLLAWMQHRLVSSNNPTRCVRSVAITLFPTCKHHSSGTSRGRGLRQAGLSFIFSF